jgi:hypothetical protein
MAATPDLAVPLRPVAFCESEAGGLDDQLRHLARAQAPLRRAMVAFAGRFVELRGWERLGFARLRDYATERLGLSARSLQDFAYVDRALRELPRLDRSLTRGELAWTKVRLLARVATAGDEARWIERARAASVRSLEREVRRVDVGALENGAAETDPEGESGEVKEGVRIRCSREVRARWWRVRQLANRAAGEALPVWVAMENLAAEVASALPLEAPVDDGETFAATVAAASNRRRRRRANGCAAHARAPDPPDLPPLLRSLVDGLEDADPFELDARLRRAVAQEQRFDAELSALLLGVAEREHYRSWGYPDLAAYVRERLGMSPRKARALLRLERAGKRCPELVNAYREGRLSWVQAHALVPVALVDGAPHEAWIRWTRRVTVRRLEDEVGGALARYELGLPLFPEPPSDDPSRDSIDETDDGEAERQTCAHPTGSARIPEETARPFFSAPRPVARFFRAVLCSTRRHLERHTGRLPTEGEAFGWMLDHALAVWEAEDPHMRRTQRAHAVFARDGWRCTVPGCTSYRNLHDHHIRFRSAGGSNALRNRTTLCAHHHQRGVHAGVVRCTGRAPGRLRFELGLRAGRPPLAVYRSGDVVS